MCAGATTLNMMSHGVATCPLGVHILAEGAIALSVTLSGGALLASRKLLRFLSSLIANAILALFFMRAPAQHKFHGLAHVRRRAPAPTANTPLSRSNMGAHHLCCMRVLG